MSLPGAPTMPSIEHEISKAIDGGEFVPYLQPIVELRSGRIEGFEILARWFHPVLGPVAPNDFIPIIEKYELTNALSRCLLQRALLAGNLLPERMGLSVNVAPAQLHDRTLPELLERVAGDLKKLGVRLALDDFGTGYSSLLHLQSLPFDELKIDGSFVRSMAASRQSRKITAAVVTLGESLGLRTVAEGIEQRDQAELLVWQGCNLGQGWMYGHPVPLERLAGVMERETLGITESSAISRDVAKLALSVETQSKDRISQLQAIYDGAPAGLCFLDRDLRYVSLNRRMAEMNGLPLEAHLGRRVADVLPERFRQVEQNLRCALKGEATPPVTVHSPALGGVKGSVLVSYQPARDESGEVVGVSVCVLDLSTLNGNVAAPQPQEDPLRLELHA